MAVNIDWSQARGQGNAFAAAMDGYQAGRALAKQQGSENALAKYTTDPEGGIAELAKYDPDAAIRLGQSRVAAQHEATTYQQGQDDRARVQKLDQIKSAVGLLGGIQTPEQWEQAKHDPLLASLVPDIAEAPFETMQQLRAYGEHLLTKPEAFTLAAGQKRFGPDGQEIASVDPAPVRPVVVGQGAVALGPDGTPVFKNPKTYAPPRPGAAGSGVPPLPPGFVIEK